MLQKILKSRFLQFVGSAILILLLFFLAQQMYRKYQINQEISNLQSDITSLESKNQDILKMISYLKTTEYKERQARSLLGLQKPGEFAVALPGGEDEQTLGAETKDEQKNNNNFIKWWNYFFSKS